MGVDGWIDDGKVMGCLMFCPTVGSQIHKLQIDRSSTKHFVTYKLQTDVPETNPYYGMRVVHNRQLMDNLKKFDKSLVPSPKAINS
jgi:hypothetical protein